MLDLNGRVVVATDNAGAEWPDVRADCAIDMLNIGGPMTRNWERHRLGRYDMIVPSVCASTGEREVRVMRLNNALIEVCSEASEIT